jgi:signal transduction histidine kinase
MHFTGMTAFALNPNPAVQVPAMTMAPGTVAVGIAAVAFLVMALGLVGVTFDRQQGHVRDLKATKLRLELMAEELKVALEASQRASHARTTFFSTMSHELRTPLNAIIGFSEMLNTEVFGPLGNPRNAEYIRDIHASGMKLLHLVNDVLDISRLNAGKMELREEQLSIDELIVKAMRTTETQAAKAGVRMHRTVPHGLPHVFGDEKRLEQVLLNLLSNAIKFTPAGGRIDVAVGRCENGMHIVVSDTGIGIKEADLAKLFERFVQIDSSLSRRYQGAGLGLEISKQLVELHGGTLTLESMEGAGTRAIITLPSSRLVTDSLILPPATLAPRRVPALADAIELSFGERKRPAAI